MESAALSLKALRERARPKLSVRGMAAALGMSPSKYTHYENPKTFKKSYLPMDMVRELVPILGAHNIAEADVLALGGVEAGAGEVVPIPPLPPIQFVTMQVALPSEAALARMFEGLLRPVDHQKQSAAELAQILARRLPTGLAQLRDLLPAPLTGAAPERDADPQAPATDHPESRRAPNT
jgi:hypothetical protein